jgi:hypothetical protein
MFDFIIAAIIVNLQSHGVNFHLNSFIIRQSIIFNDFNILRINRIIYFLHLFKLYLFTKMNLNEQNLFYILLKMNDKFVFCIL